MSCLYSEGLPQRTGGTLNYLVNTEEKNVTGKGTKPFILTQCPTEWKTFTLGFHTQVNVPQKPNVVFKDNNANHKPPKNQRHFYIDQFLPSHAHFLWPNG